MALERTREMLGIIEPQHFGCFGYGMASGEQLLGTLRGEFARFGETLERMRQRLDQATGELDTATARSRAITRRLDELDRYE